MTEQERINSETQMKLAIQDAKFNVFMQEMRDRDNQRAAEIMELRQKQNEDTKSLDAKIERLGDKIQTLVIAAVVGFGAIIVAVVSALKH